MPAAQSYAYFMTGRRTTPEGHEGAYNLYGQELRQNIILGQPDQISQQPEQIKQAQYMICQAVQESSSLPGAIENNTAITACNPSIPAESAAISRRYGC